MENGSYSSSSEASTVSSIAQSDDIEVKKLKDLVKKLEKQNEHLRHRTGKLSSTASKLTKQKSEKYVAGGDASTNLSSNSSINGFTKEGEDIEELDVDDPVVKSVLYGNETTWLFRSPKASGVDNDDQVFTSPIEWVNEEFKNPSTPQLKSARRNILYKMGLSLPDISTQQHTSVTTVAQTTIALCSTYCEPDHALCIVDPPNKVNLQSLAPSTMSTSLSGSSTDLSYLSRGVEKRLLFHSDDYKHEDATDVKVAARLQQDELNKNSAAAVQRHNSNGSPSNTLSRRRDSYEEESQNSSPTQFSHHLPMPSQTMTTAHGLYPASRYDDEPEGGARGRRPLTPNKYERNQSNSVGSSPRTLSPARSRQQARSPSRRSLPNPSRTSPKTSVRTSSPNRQTLSSTSPRSNPTRNHSNALQQPSIRSSLVAPGRMSRLQQKSTLPSPSVSSGAPTGTRTLAAPRAASPMTSQRRSLPRPSQTSTTLRYSSSRLPSNSTNASPQTRKTSPSSDVWGDDEVY